MSAARIKTNMTETQDQVLMAETHRRSQFFFAAVCSAAIVASGCVAATQKKAAIPWRTAVLVRPVTPQKASLDEDDPLPDIEMDVDAPSVLPLPRAVPLRPRVPTPAANPNAPAEKLDAPQIMPELSAQESSSLHRETDQSLGAAERNLAATTKKSLNATQTDLVSKIRSFIRDAKEAGKAGDWARARDLARKAQVLSEELVSSL
jgi:hypothetical protein